MTRRIMVFTNGLSLGFLFWFGVADADWRLTVMALTAIVTGWWIPFEDEPR